MGLAFPVARAMSATRVYFVQEDGSLRRIPLTVFDRLHRSGGRMAEYAGRRVRYVLTSLETEDRQPVAVSYTEYGVLTFDERGRLDDEVRSKGRAFAMESISSALQTREPGPVIEARGRVARKRYGDGFEWKPAQAELEAIRVAI